MVYTIRGDKPFSTEFCHCPVATVLKSFSGHGIGEPHSDCRYMVKRTDLWEHISCYHSELIGEDSLSPLIFDMLCIKDQVDIIIVHLTDKDGGKHVGNIVGQVCDAEVELRLTDGTYARVPAATLVNPIFVDIAFVPLHRIESFERLHIK